MIFYDPDLEPIKANLPLGTKRPGYWKGLIWIEKDGHSSLNFDVLGKRLFINWQKYDYRIADANVKNRLYEPNDIIDKHNLINELFSYRLKA